MRLCSMPGYAAESSVSMIVQAISNWKQFAFRIGQNAVCNAMYKHHLHCMRSRAMQLLIVPCFTS